MFCTVRPLTASCMGAHVSGSCVSGEVDTHETNCRTVSCKDVNVHDTTVDWGYPLHRVEFTSENDSGSVVATAERDSRAHRSSAWA